MAGLRSRCIIRERKRERERGACALVELEGDVWGKKTEVKRVDGIMAALLTLPFDEGAAFAKSYLLLTSTTEGYSIDDGDILP